MHPVAVRSKTELVDKAWRALGRDRRAGKSIGVHLRHKKRNRAPSWHPIKPRTNEGGRADSCRVSIGDDKLQTSDPPRHEIGDRAVQSYHVDIVNRVLDGFEIDLVPIEFDRRVSRNANTGGCA